MGPLLPLRITLNRNARVKIKWTCWKAPESNQVMQNNWGSLVEKQTWRLALSDAAESVLGDRARGWCFQVRGQRWDLGLAMVGEYLPHLRGP